jgi:hypothetical protein
LQPVAFFGILFIFFILPRQLALAPVSARLHAVSSSILALFPQRVFVALGFFVGEVDILFLLRVVVLFVVELAFVGIHAQVFVLPLEQLQPFAPG